MIRKDLEGFSPACPRRLWVRDRRAHGRRLKLLKRAFSVYQLQYINVDLG